MRSLVNIWWYYLSVVDPLFWKCSAKWIRLQFLKPLRSIIISRFVSETVLESELEMRRLKVLNLIFSTLLRYVLSYPLLLLTIQSFNQVPLTLTNLHFSFVALSLCSMFHYVLRLYIGFDGIIARAPVNHRVLLFMQLFLYPKVLNSVNVHLKNWTVGLNCLINYWRCH